MRLTVLVLACSSLAHAALYTHGRQLMVCHRTADRDYPENTLEAIREAKILGCDIVEMDISRTLDGVLVLLHDGPIDRVSSGSGEVEKMLSGEMALYDAGAWFNPRFKGIRHPRFLDALRLAKDLGLKLELDLKSRGIVRQVYEMAQAEGMLERVSFGGHAEGLQEVAPNLPREATASWKPDMDHAAVARIQEHGKFVVASFSANDHELDFPLMRRAVAAGVDAVSTDHPRLAAEALGRSIESRALSLARQARQDDPTARLRAISELSDLRDLPLTAIFSNLIWDGDPAISRAAALSLARRREADAIPALLAKFDEHSQPSHAGANLAWLAGITAADGARVHAWLVARASSAEPDIAAESLRALAGSKGDAPLALLRRQLENPHPLVRGAAALALARHDSTSASVLRAAAQRLQKEMYACWSAYAKPSKTNDLSKARTTFERPNPSRPGAPAQIAQATELYRAYENVLRAMESLHTPEATRWLEEETLRVAPDFSGIGAYIAATQLWDKGDPQALAPGLEMEDPMRRDRAQWTLLKHGPSSAPELRRLLGSRDADARIRAAETLAWLGDVPSKPALQNLIQSDPEQKDLYEWCLRKLEEVEQLRRSETF